MSIKRKIRQTIVKVNVMDKQDHFRWTKLEIVEAPIACLFYGKSESEKQLIDKCCDNIARAKARKNVKEVEEIAFSTEQLKYRYEVGWDKKF